MSVLKALPIIVIGKTDEVGRRVMQNLLPECEVVAFLRSKEASVAEIPSVLKGQPPADPQSTIGTGNLAQRPVAIAVGGGFTAAFDELHDAVEAACGSKGSGVAWLKNDTTKPGPQVLGAEYGKSVADRLKGVLGRLEAEGKTKSGEGNVYLY